MDNLKPLGRGSFTLIELLIAVAIIGILGAATVYVINPSELLAQARDSSRLDDLGKLKLTLGLLQIDSSIPSSLGSPQTVYLSLPDANSNCASYPLPNLPSGWSYRCASSSTLQKIDGSGWLPIDLASLTFRSPVSALPIDPKNNQANYYSYSTDGSGWELNSKFESWKNIVGGDNSYASTDGGDDFTRYEVGTDLTVAPWSFNFSFFTTSTNNSGLAGWFPYANYGTVSLGSEDRNTFLRASGYIWYVWQENIPFNPTAVYKVSCALRQVTDPTSPTTSSKAAYCGWAGVAQDGVTLVNYAGLNSYSSQHYHARVGGVLPLSSTFATYTGYTSGWKSPNGDSGSCSSPSSPCRMQANTRFIRPLFILNYSNGNGVADIASFQVTKQ
ncbi:MAG: type II secretion system protein [Patescibacteria group bacterium]|nr:type II secretion system protein [Patescibacteria group bacterium]